MADALTTLSLLKQPYDPEFERYLNTLPTNAERIAAGQIYRTTGTYPYTYSDRRVPLFENKEPTGEPIKSSRAKETAKKAVEATKQTAKKLVDTTIRDAGSKIAQGAKAGAKAVSDGVLNLGRNALSGLSGLGDTSLGAVIRTAGPLATVAGLGYEGLKAAGDYAADVQRGYERAGVADESPVVYGEDGTITDPETGMTWTLPGRGKEAVAAMAPVAPVTPKTNEAIGAQINAEEAALDPRTSEATDLAYLKNSGVLADDTQPVLTPASAPEFTQNPLTALNGLSDAELVKGVLAGKYGNGADRRKALGDRYAAIQALVNQRMGSAKPKATSTYSVESPRRTDRMIRPMTIGEAYQRGMGNFTVLDDEPNKYIK